VGKCTHVHYGEASHQESEPCTELVAASDSIVQQLFVLVHFQRGHCSRTGYSVPCRAHAYIWACSNYSARMVKMVLHWLDYNAI
jgi:hypothetical protein